MEECSPFDVMGMLPEIEILRVRTLLAHTHSASGGNNCVLTVQQSIEPYSGENQAGKGCACSGFDSSPSTYHNGLEGFE
jgi:hypothetical protein